MPLSNCKDCFLLTISCYKTVIGVTMESKRWILFLKLPNFNKWEGEKLERKENNHLKKQEYFFI